MLEKITSAIARHPKAFLAGMAGMGFLAGFLVSIESTVQRLTYDGHHPQFWQVLHSILTDSYFNWDGCGQAVSINSDTLIPREQICSPVYAATARPAFDAMPTLVGAGLGVGVGAAGPYLREKEKA